MAYKKVIRKVARKAYGAVKTAVKKRYTTKSGGANYKQIAKDVMMLKSMVNAEKKNADLTDTTQYAFAQNLGALSGAYTSSIIPTMAQGIGEDNRIGDSVKICSYVFQAEVETNSFNTIQDTKYKLYLVRQPTNPVSGVTVRDNFLEPNVFSGVVDYNSNRNYQNFKDFVILGVINGKLTQNSNDSVGQVKKNQHKIARKAEFHVRYDKGTNNILNNNIHLIAVADSGDVGSPGLNILKIRYSMKVFFYDN